MITITMTEEQYTNMLALLNRVATNIDHEIADEVDAEDLDDLFDEIEKCAK